MRLPKQQGFTLVEMLVVMFIMAIILPYVGGFNTAEDNRQKRSDKISSEILTFFEQSRRFHLNNNAWPDEANNCADAINILTSVVGGGPYFDNIDDSNPLGNAYTFNCAPGDAIMTVSTTVDVDWARYLEGDLPGTIAVDSDRKSVV